ncbi:uncharacterized protein LTR77_000545 [Saxophila tyrrhenica]|uniref:Zn(2)-C6 fungal-type domain-containing protein n=1 Tax=Saxophila tyrrhenica TaxID=1690608 RepID=A0AAV9PN61_9PEZI|nr:hypothetical protein LTR77_000545 [Saxophila tyrrhenica]
MVGVPGRSRGCSTCKQRRVKCDQEKPCGQCTKAKRECLYPQNHIFVHHEGNHKTVYRKSDKDRTVKKSGLPAPTPTSDTPCLPPKSFTSLAILQPIGTLSVLKQQFLSEACSKELLQSRELNAPKPWTYSLSTFAGSVYALNSAPLSCYTAWIGRRNREPWLVEASRRLYIQGLKEVQAAINDPTTALRDETLAACLTLIIYEALECPDRSRSGYAAHVAGCARIVKMRGPSMHQHGAAHQLFGAFRYIALFHDVELHKPSFLSSPAWTTLPWQDRDKTMNDRLFDLLSLAPEVLQKSDRLPSIAPGAFMPALLDLAHDVAMTDSKLQAFYAELVESSPDPLYWEEPSRGVTLEGNLQSNPLQVDCETTAFRFRDYDTATTLCTYWALLAMSWSGMTDIQNTLLDMTRNNLICAQLVPAVKHLTLEARDWLDPVRKVLKGVRFCSTEGTGEVGPTKLAIPLDIVTDVMKGRSGCAKERAEAVRIGEEISSRFLRIMQFKDPPLRESA